MDLRSIRKAKGLTLLEMEEKTGISNAYLSQVERHKKMLSDEMAAILAPHLGMEAMDLKIQHTESAFASFAEQLRKTDLQKVKELTEKKPEKVSQVLDGLANIIDDDSISADFRKVARQVADRLLAAKGKV